MTAIPNDFDDNGHVEDEGHEGAPTALVPRQETGAVALPVAPVSSIVADPYVGVAALPFDARAQEALSKYETVDADWIDIRPEGLLYLSHMKARHILNQAFGYGGWAIVPVGDFTKEEKGNHIILYRQYRLYVNGRYVGETVAAGDYWTNNSSQNYADAAEACQSYALNRLCKNFGIASQCWDKAYGERWKASHAETFIKNGNTQWRKKQDTTGSVVGHAAAPISETASIQVPDQHRDATPNAQPSRPADPSLSLSSDDAATGKIRIASVGPTRLQKPSRQFPQGRPMAFVKDTNGIEWSFLGEGAIAAARIAEGTDMLVRVTYTINGKYRNVTGVADV